MYVVMDKDGNLWGPFENTFKGVSWAGDKWPEQPRHDDRIVGYYREGWSIVAIRPAD